jgi:hypothetical protein
VEVAGLDCAVPRAAAEKRENFTVGRSRALASSSQVATSPPHRACPGDRESDLTPGVGGVGLAIPSLLLLYYYETYCIMLFRC